MGKRYLIDSNVIIEFIGNLLPKSAYSIVAGISDDKFNISVINKIEILGHNTADKNIEDFINLAEIIGICDEIVSKTIEIRKINKTKLPNAIIATTAIVNNLTIVTRNTKDFDKIKGLSVASPHSI